MADTLHKLRNGLDVTKRLCVTFIGESAVNTGGPLQEYFTILMRCIAQNNLLFCGKENSRVPVHNVLEMERCTFYLIGSIVAF